MSKVVDEIEEKVGVEKIDEKNLLDFKLAGRMSYGVIFFDAELWCDRNSPRLSGGVIQISPG